MTVRVAVAGDLHLGSGQQLTSDRPADHDRTLNQLADLLSTERAELLLLAGDIFHRPRPAPETLLLFRRFTRRLEALEIPTIAITGNAGHDIENGDRPCALELFQSDWLRLSRTPELILAAGDVAVCTLPSVPVSRRVAAHDGGDRSLIFDETVELLVAAAADLRRDVPAGWPSILLGHWSVTGANLPNGLPVADLHEPVLPLPQLEQLAYDACVFGHIHQPQVLTPAHPFVAYTGTPHVVDFGETHVDHGFWTLELGGTGNVDAAYIPVDDRRFVTVDVDLTDGHADALREGLDDTDVIAAHIATELPLTGAVVRVRYRATEDQHRSVDRQALIGFLAEAGADKVHGPTWEPVRTSRARVDVNGDGLSDQDALAMWCDAHDLPEQRRVGVHRLLEQIEAA